MARRTKWSDRLLDDTTPSGVQSRFNLMSALDIDERQGITIVRQLITLTIMPSPTNGVVGVQRCDMGIGLVSADAFTAAVMPDPDDATDRPVGGWLWRTRLGILDDSTQVPVPGLVNVDSRAKRRMSGGELSLIVNNSGAQGTAFTIRIVGIIRTLYLLP